MRTTISTIEQSIEVDAPRRIPYNQWTRFEAFPRVMEGVESVRPIDDTHLHRVAEFGGLRHDRDAKITEQIRVAWVKGDLGRFKELIEAHRAASGGWRGEDRRPDEAGPV